MPDHISYMLDSMITAVDESLSYDGIVSIPEAGLEDVKPKIRITDSLRDGVDRVRVTRVAISRGAASVFKPKRHDPSRCRSETIIRGKNRSEQSLATDHLSEVSTEEKPSTSSLVHSEWDERNHFAREQTALQDHRDEIDIVPGCFQRPSANRTHSEPIIGKGSRLTQSEQAREAEGWHFVPVGTGEMELLVAGKDGTERRDWKTRFKGLQGKGAESVQRSASRHEPAKTSR